MSAGTTTLLAVNAGSSSLKAALFALDRRSGDLTRLAGLSVPQLDRSELVITVPGAPEERSAWAGAPLPAVLDALRRLGLPMPGAVGHRFVHGGPDLTGPVLLSAHVLETLSELVAWAPLHQPAALAGVATVTRELPDARQVGCFDTAFHRTMPEVAQRLPLPDWVWAAGIRRYGFHGLSYEHVVETVGAQQLGRAVVAHLGNGSSLAAIRAGRSVDTTMGFTPEGGVVMGTRSGDVDPGVLLHLLETGSTVAAVRDAVQVHGGLLGLSGATSDMRALLALREAGHAAATRAVTAYCRRIRMQVGAYAALLGGLDTLVFTGGIGEHAEAVRVEICEGLQHLGARVLVVPADEELVIARQTARCTEEMGAGGPSAA